MRSLSISSSLLLCGLYAMGQSAGTLTGTVSDPANAVVAGAPVEAKNTNTGFVYKASTSGTGNYTISELPAGKYDITVTAPGFKKENRPNVEVQASTTFRVDFALQVGTASESVTITAEAPELKTESGELSHNVSTDTLDSLPILTIGTNVFGSGGVRNPLAALQLLPGASYSGDLTLVINGMPNSSQSIRIEGQDATNGLWRVANSVDQTGVDAIQEIVVETSNFAAEYGQAGGGYVNMTMKSGTNQYHGGAFDYLANDAFNAGLANTNAATSNALKAGQHVRPSLRRNDFGGTFGGPVRLGKLYNGTNKTFFFFSYEEYNTKTLTTNSIATVPTAAYQAGNFGTAVGPALIGSGNVDPLGNALFASEIFDPNSTRQVNGLVVRTPFPNQVIPATQLDPTALKIQALLPQPNTGAPGALTNNYLVPSYFNFQHNEVPTLKLDHNLSPTKKLAVFYSANHVYSPGNNGYTQVFSGATPTQQLSQTTRVNYDQTITPTLLMHVGLGLIQTSQWNTPAYTYNQSQLFGSGVFPGSQYFPTITPGSGAYGGSTVGMGPAGFALPGRDTKPTFTNSFTWVRGNHTYKFGGELIFEGLPIVVGDRAFGQIAFSANETADPYATGLTFANGSTGYSYASFLTGNTNSVVTQGLDDMRLGNHSFGLYAQDSWKVTRKLNVDYGLRYDFATLLAEEHGRMQNAAFNLPNPAIGGRLGTVIYGGSNNYSGPMNSNYPYALGPRLGIAYQIDKNTVLRLGSGITYGTSPNNSYLSYSIADFYTFQDQPLAGVAASQLRYGNPQAAGNPFGVAPLQFPNFNPLYPFQTAPGYSPPESPFISLDRHAGRLPRQIQWSLGLQRAVSRGLVVEAAYVGNRGVWWTAPLMDTPNMDGLQLSQLASFGLNPNSASDLALLNTPIASANGTPNATIAQRFPNLKVVMTPGGLPTVPSVYPGFPATQGLGQALRPYPQWTGVPPFLGPPNGKTWYDSLQAKVTKRFSHGLSANYAFTWQKGLAEGAEGDTSYVGQTSPVINDVYNYASNKQLNQYVRPLISIISFTYQTPKLHGDSGMAKGLSWVTKDWTLAGLATYQSGALIELARSNNNLLNELQVGAVPFNNPAIWGGAATAQNLVAGQPLFNQGISANCFCFNPGSQLALNPKAFVDAPAGTYGTAPPFVNNYRWQRQPSESASFGRIFPLSKEEKVKLQIRMEFTSNLFNRFRLSAPSSTNPTATTTYLNQTLPGNTAVCSASTLNPGCAINAGYGFVNTYNGAGQSPRQGQIVARLTF
jgi:hypothetical protein